MQKGYFKTNIQVLKFDNIKDTDKIIFNHYIMKKSKLQQYEWQSTKRPILHKQWHSF